MLGYVSRVKLVVCVRLVTWNFISKIHVEMPRIQMLCLFHADSHPMGEGLASNIYTTVQYGALTLDD